MLAAGRVVGWFQGRMEFGPRALGARSILADARDPAMRSRLNRRIKLREGFRPFAPSVLAEAGHATFDLPAGRHTPYMALTTQVRGAASPSGTAIAIPAVTHVDGSARVQTVDRVRHGRYRRLLERFAAVTGCPVLVNTSLNVRGEPIACSPQDAIRCLLGTDLDALAIGDFLMLADQQPPPLATRARQEMAAIPPD